MTQTIPAGAQTSESSIATSTCFALTKCLTLYLRRPACEGIKSEVGFQRITDGVRGLQTIVIVHLVVQMTIRPLSDTSICNSFPRDSLTDDHQVHAVDENVPDQIETHARDAVKEYL